jgi:hypothetical protein
MSDERWIVVPNWEKFQHYNDRTPVWIKVYAELNSSDEWTRLTLAERGLLVTVWLEFGRSRGQCSVGHVQRLCGSSARVRHFEALSDAGFIEISASKPLALRYHSRAPARSREEISTEISKEGASARAKESSRSRLEKNIYPAAHSDNELAPRDPHAAERLRAMTSELFGRPFAGPPPSELEDESDPF